MNKELIEEFAMKTNLICAENRNAKLGMACISVPFPITTCNPNAPCKKGCYANKGRQLYPNVQGAYFRNLRIYNENPDNFFEQLYYKIKFSGLSLVRFFDSGDYPDKLFLLMSIELATKLPNVKFMAFTKKYEIINEWLESGGIIPDNYNIVFSAWDKIWEVPNPFNLPVAYVKFREERLTPVIPENAFHCPGRQVNCSLVKYVGIKNLNRFTLMNINFKEVII